MEFNHFLTTCMLDPSYGAKRLYADMIEQSVTAERLGYRGVSIPEHHLINILMIPSPLQMAVKIASATRRIELVTSVAVLPIRDVRILAGEVVQAHILCDGRLVLGVGRGAFAYELARLGTPIETTREKFDESLRVLEALLSNEEVCWDGAFYKFDPITIMPRPASRIPIMLAAMVPDAIYASAKKGYSIQTTPLGSAHELLLEQVGAFKRGKADAGEAGRHSRLALQRGIYAARDEADARRTLEFAYDYFKRFDNVYTGPGKVTRGIIDPLPRKQSIEDLSRNLIICPPSEMVDRLAAYAEAGIDEVITSSNFGQPQEKTIEMMHRLAEEVMPHLKPQPAKAYA